MVAVGRWSPNPRGSRGRAESGPVRVLGVGDGRSGKLLKSICCVCGFFFDVVCGFRTVGEQVIFV